MAVLCPAGCGKKFTTQEFAEKHADADHEGWRIPKSRGWRTPYGFVDYPHPVTYEQACADMAKMQEALCSKQ